MHGLTAVWIKSGSDSVATLMDASDFGGSFSVKFTSFISVRFRRPHF